ncbi:hypothetical protein [Arhodomonas sp. AD133]|uniref:hypothetical protein n=1 Tax=Arhodomonas sp. AD133 TaxID=3415009 RepID=UPI003EC12B7E
MTGLTDLLKQYYLTYGPPKPMNSGNGSLEWPHFFLHRNFLGEQDLAILFYTKRCRYQCAFCALPLKSPQTYIDGASIKTQFMNVMEEMKNSIGSFERLTIANEGSVFDETTFCPDTLDEICTSVSVVPNIRKIVIETRLEFAKAERLRALARMSGKTLDILTGFETLDERLRDDVLRKREPLSVFTDGLDEVAAAGGELTTYVLYKPDPAMTDGEAAEEAERSVDYVRDHCAARGISLTIRLNPMYVARGTPWARRAKALGGYVPPSLADVIALARRKREEGMKIYLGLTSEDLSAPEDTYRGREDFTKNQLKQGILMNLKRPESGTLSA